MPLFSNKCLSPTLPKVIFFLLSSCKGCWEQCLRPYGKDKGEGRISFIFMEHSYTKVTITNDPCLPPKSPLPPVSRSWQLSAFIAMCLSLAVSPVPAAAVPVVVFCSTVTPVTIWNPSDLAHVKWVKYLGTSQCAEDGGPDFTFGWSCPAGICLDPCFCGSRARLTCYEGSLPG